MNIFIQDNLHLSFGRIEIRDVITHVVVERGYNIFGGEVNTSRNQYKQVKKLYNGDGIKIFKSQSEIDIFLSQYETYKVYTTNYLHKEVSI